MGNKEHIDDVQPSTVDEQFNLLLNDKSTIDPKFIKVSPDDLPEWYDERLFKIGQAHYMENLFAFTTANMVGLTAILSVPDVAEVITFTKHSSTPSLMFKRMAQTVLHTYELFRSDMLDADSKWFKTMNVIRWKHVTANNRRIKQDLPGIYQRDMALMQCCFIGYPFVCLADMGLAHSTPEELEGSNHFWRIVGYLLGIADQMNVCRKTAKETTELCGRILHEIIGPHMENPIAECMDLANRSLVGVSYFDFTTNVESYLAMTCRLTGVKYGKPLGWCSYLNLQARDGVLYMCSTPYIGKAVRTMLNCAVMGVLHLLEHYPVAARRAFGQEKSRICLYPTIR